MLKSWPWHSFQPSPSVFCCTLAPDKWTTSFCFMTQFKETFPPLFCENRDGTPAQRPFRKSACETVYVCGSGWKINRFFMCVCRASSRSSSSAASEFCHLMHCGALWPRRSRTSNAFSWASWMTLPSASWVCNTAWLHTNTKWQTTDSNHIFCHCYYCNAETIGEDSFCYETKIKYFGQKK